MTSIIYESTDSAILVVDIPTSISDAQGSGDSQLRLLSSPAIQQPWPGNEPKSEKAKAKLKAQQPQNDVEIQKVVADALTLVRSDYNGLYCLRRSTTQTGQKRPRSPSLEHHPKQLNQGQEDVWSGFDLWSNEDASGTKNDPSNVNSVSKDTQFASMTELSRILVSNISSSSIRVGVTDMSTIYSIPPQSSFFLGDCSASAPFHRAVQQQAHQQRTKALFDVIVMDPPWPSASVRRSAQKGQAHYSVIRTLDDMRELLFDLELGSLLAGNGTLAVWITNKPSIRDMLLSPNDGLFERCNLQLVEEWIWVKVTEDGVPVLPLDGLWRKPYEVLLIGRARSDLTADTLPHKIKRRVILAVPDLHSRKPCLKTILEKTFCLPSNHRGLEIFARNLTSGWHAWGNEVLKFNDVSCWTRKDYFTES